MTEAIGHVAALRAMWRSVWPISGNLAFDRETDFDRHLPVMHLALRNVPTGFDDLKPGESFDRLVSASDGVVHGVFHGFAGCAGEFDEFVNGIFHIGNGRSRADRRSVLAIVSKKGRW